MSYTTRMVDGFPRWKANTARGHRRVLLLLSEPSSEGS
jgi:hypothetical protein